MPSNRLQKFFDIIKEGGDIVNYYPALINLRHDILEYLNEPTITQRVLAKDLNMSEPKLSVVVSMLRAVDSEYINNKTYLVLVDYGTKIVPYEI